MHRLRRARRVHVDGLMRRTVLVVDANAKVRALHRSLLAQRGYEVLEAGDIAEALTGLARAPHAVVLDLGLPEDSAVRILDFLARRRGAPPTVLCASTPQATRIARRYHIAALGTFALEAIGDEVDRVIAESQRPRLSRVSGSDSRPSLL